MHAQFHEALIYFILPCALIAFVLGCRKHGDMKVAIMGSIGIILLASAVILHEALHSDQHSESLMSVLITVVGSVILIFAHMRNRKLCAKHNYECHE